LEESRSTDEAISGPYAKLIWPVFVEATPATPEDFVKFINGGNKLILSYKPITVDAATKLAESEYKLVVKPGALATNKPQYYQLIYVPAPK
jgi:hypothetical protein